MNNAVAVDNAPAAEGQEPQRRGRGGRGGERRRQDADTATTDASQVVVDGSAPQDGQVETSEAGEARAPRERRGRDRYGRDRRQGGQREDGDASAPSSDAGNTGDAAEAVASEAPVRSYFTQPAAATAAPVTAEEAAPAEAPAAPERRERAERSERAPRRASESTAANAAAVAAPVAPAPAAPKGMPKVQPFELPLSDLDAVARASGLEWVNSDAAKVAQVQAAIAAEPRPVHVPREPKPPVVIDEGPLILVETRKDLREMTLPFEAR